MGRIPLLAIFNALHMGKSRPIARIVPSMNPNATTKMMEKQSNKQFYEHQQGYVVP